MKEETKIGIIWGTFFTIFMFFIATLTSIITKDIDILLYSVYHPSVYIVTFIVPIWFFSFIVPNNCKS